MSFKDKMLSKIGNSIEEEKQEKIDKSNRSRPLKERVKKDGVQNYVRDVPKVETEYKSVRHLVEFLLLKYPDIKFNNSEVLVKRNFPTEVYDTGTFMMIKLQWVRDKYLMYKDDLIKYFPNIKGE